MPDGEQEFQARATERLVFFSDAVVAIAITLLAIDLPVPTGHTTSAFLTSARHNGGHYGAFLISFLSIAAAWSHHHDLMRYARRIDPRLRTLNTTWLLMIVLIPFATKLLTTPGHDQLTVHALRFGFYALIQAVESLALLAMLRHMVTEGQAPGIPKSEVAATALGSAGLLLGFGLSIPVFFATTYGWALWIIVPTLIRFISHYRYRRGGVPDLA